MKKALAGPRGRTAKRPPGSPLVAGAAGLAACPGPCRKTVEVLAVVRGSGFTLTELLVAEIGRAHV